MLRILTMLAFCSLAFAQNPYPDPGIGSRPGAFSARSLGLGHTFMTSQSGPAAMMGNPATMAQQVERWHLELQSDVSRVREVRSYPFYDSFNGVLNYNNYANNDHLYSKLDGGVSWRATKEAVPSLVLSVASYSTYRFDYQYREEVRDRYTSGGVQDRYLGEDRIDVNGDLRSVTFGAAASANERFSAGASLSLLSGDWTYLRGTYYANPDSTNIGVRQEFSPSGTPAEFNLGATYWLNQRIMLGARALVPTGDFKYDVASKEFTSDSTVSGTFSQTYPSRFGAGVQYRPQNEFRPSLYLESEIITYSDVQTTYDNTFEIRAGAEQSIVPGTPVRFGFIYTSSPDNNNRATTLFTAGIGFTLDRLSGDFGVEIGKLNYTADDLFPQQLWGGNNRIDRDQVETSLFRGLITLGWAI